MMGEAASTQVTPAWIRRWAIENQEGGIGSFFENGRGFRDREVTSVFQEAGALGF